MRRPSAIRVCPEQNSMSGSATSGAELGEPAAGVQSRGRAMLVVPASHLPHASTLPVGNRLMCSGTMSHDTGASHWPLVAWAGRGLSVTVDEVMAAEPVA